MVDRVAGHRRAVAGAAHLAQHLARAEHHPHRQQPQASHLPGPGLDRVVDLARRASGSRRRCRAPAGPRGPGPRAPRPARARAASPGRPRWPGSPAAITRSASASSAGLVANRTSTPGSAASASTSVKLLIRGGRSTPPGEHRRPRRARPSRPAGARASESSTSEPEAFAPGQHAEHRPPGQPAQLVEPGGEQLGRRRGTC